MLGFDYGMAIYASDKMWTLDGAATARATSARAIGAASESRRFAGAPGGRERAGKALVAVRLASGEGAGGSEQGFDPMAEWLLIEWPMNEDVPTGYFLTTLPRKMSKKEIVRLIKERYRTEQVYEELKGELGLDHFEGRSFPGWHHHISVVLCAYAFLVAERSRGFPPSARGQGRSGAVRSAA